MKPIILILIIQISILFISCEKENINIYPNQPLEFSVDTIMFDTIFSTISSITKTLKVYNNNNFEVSTNISISDKINSHYRINVDGESGNYFNNIVIDPNDSIFIFVEVTIDPNNTNTPYLISDSIIFISGEKQQKIKLIAYGQDAIFHTANTFGNIITSSDTTKFYYHEITTNETWNNEKPHVIYGYVIINPNCELIIEQGTKIYLHKNSGIIVGNPFSNGGGSSLKVYGTLGNEVTFQGDRLDSWYDSIPGQWDRIWLFPGSVNNEFHYTNIKNGTVGIQADTIGNNNPTVIINNCRIDNMSSIGILGQGANIETNNTIITKCGQHLIACNIGGKYSFKHCTLVNYWNYNNRNTPSILLNNYYEGVDGNTYYRDLETAFFGNCILDGSLSTEISFQENENSLFNYKFDYCLIKIDPQINTENSKFNNIIKNENPQFKNKNTYDFHLNENSLCINSGDINITQSSPILFNDIEGVSRGSLIDIGALEFSD